MGVFSFLLHRVLSLVFLVVGGALIALAWVWNDMIVAIAAVIIIVVALYFGLTYHW